jgi:glycosyltransferase involved in cell wall biosynthesis
MAPCSAREFKLPLGKARRRPYITYCGSSYPGKGVDVVVELARLLPTEQFLIVTRSGDAVESLMQHSPTNIDWKIDVVNTEVYELLAQSKIAIAPYSRTSLTSGGWSNTPHLSPLKVFEYMACGCLVVASRLPAIEEVIDDGETGLLFEPDNIKSLHTAVERALAIYECEEVPELVLNSLQVFRQKYSYSARAESIVALAR